MTPTGADWEKGILPDKDERSAYPVLEWRVAAWREESFGVRPNVEMQQAAISLWLGDRYLNGHGKNPYFPDYGLPRGADRSWKRGTWADAPVTWLDRATDLWLDIEAESRRPWRSCGGDIG